ncbi:MAG TPA: hypothetical protein VMR41_04030 [Patescibacteria group bacterium]|nr:hypothetical protein [Patescibacteria group bacterium]
MNIGFDLDKIFVDYPPLIPDNLVDKLYKKKDNGILLYRIPTRPEQILRSLSHLPFLRPTIKKNIDFLQSIPKTENKLYLISSRFSFLEKTTNNLMHKKGFDKIFDGMYFNFSNKQPHEFKDEVLKKLHIDRYVDDDFSLLKYEAKHNKNTQFFWLNPQKGKHMLTRNITAINNLSDILN